MSWCRNCFNIYMRIWKKTSKGREGRRQYGLKNKERLRRYYKEWYAKNGRNREVDYQEAIIKWRKSNLKAVKAGKKLNYGIRTGIIVKPNRCTVCKEKRRLSGHHADYNKPLEVTWLCSSCHKIEHNKNAY